MGAVAPMLNMGRWCAGCAATRLAAFVRRGGSSRPGDRVQASPDGLEYYSLWYQKPCFPFMFGHSGGPLVTPFGNSRKERKTAGFDQPGSFSEKDRHTTHLAMRLRLGKRVGLAVFHSAAGDSVSDSQGDLPPISLIHRSDSLNPWKGIPFFPAFCELKREF